MRAESAACTADTLIVSRRRPPGRNRALAEAPGPLRPWAEVERDGGVLKDHAPGNVSHLA
eukprot:5108585-Alexandrium_andersonii.AAC.1